MKTRGIVRRIDELGRVVLPVELRRSLRIEEGDCLEIVCTDEGILLKKHGALQDREAFCQSVADALHRALDRPVVVFDTQRVTAVAGCPRSLVGVAPDSAFTEPLRARRTTTARSKALFDGSPATVVPLIRNGELFGGVAFGSDAPADLAIAKACCDFLSQFV